MKSYPHLILALAILILTSCGGSKTLDVKGEQEAVNMASSMMEAMGGKELWSEIKSVYIRTITSDAQSGRSFVFEQWITLDEPKIMNKRTYENSSEIQILNGNDGWIVTNGQVNLMPNQMITQLLNWRNNFLMTNMKKLALGGKEMEVRIIDPNSFEMYEGSKMVAGFELNDAQLPGTYYINLNSGNRSAMMVDEWGTYKGMAYPVAIREQDALTNIRTDYWDPSPLDAEKAFKISFNPNDLLNK